jgi:hypothetical protein
VNVGEQITFNGVTFRIVEIMPFKTVTNREMVMIAYQLLDRRFTSSVAHLALERREPIQPHVEKIIDAYIQTRESVRRGPR